MFFLMAKSTQLFFNGKCEEKYSIGKYLSLKTCGEGAIKKAAGAYICTLPLKYALCKYLCTGCLLRLNTFD